MNNSGLLTKRIPTVVGLLILIGGLVAGVVLVNRQQNTGVKAGPTSSPKNVKITNLGTNTFSTSWTTDTPVTGFIKYSENPAKITTPAGDLRDQISGSAQSYTNHYVNITGLKTDTTYYFVIGSGPQSYNDDGKPFQVRTGSQVIPPPEDVVSGKIINSAGEPSNGAIVYLDVEGGQSLSTVTKNDGTWRINLASSRTKEGQVLTYDKEKTILSIFVQSGVNGTATAITNTSKDNPVPDIVLGKNQSFIDTVAPLSEQQAAEVAKVGEGFKTLANTPSQSIDVALPSEATGSLQIINPAINGEMVATSSPELKGKALPGTDIQITVNSAIEQTVMIKADSEGLWSWTPPQGLEPGLHTMTISYQDENGVVQKIERNFTVLAADAGAGLPAFTATPSATPTDIITEAPTSTPTATPTISTETVMPATSSPELTATGNETYAFVLAGAGIVMFIFGRFAKKWSDS